MSKTVLIVDDDPIVRLVIQKMIQNFDNSVKCYQSENGELGLAELKNLQNTTDFLVVLLDINMPVLNGWGFLEGLQKLNLDAFFKFQIYIVTSSTDETDKLKAQSYPLIKNVYHKPLSKQDIGEILNSEDMA
jgi:two-component system, chemotaxis family, chemotaxis protein CheY